MSDETPAADAQPPVAVAEPTHDEKTEQKAKDDRKPRRQPPYHVVLWNDDDHTFDYVIGMLQKLFGHPRERGSQLAIEVDTQGRAIVLTTTREHAELKRDQIHAFGRDSLVSGCRGSMKATLEPAVQ